MANENIDKLYQILDAFERAGKDKKEIEKARDLLDDGNLGKALEIIRKLNNSINSSDKDEKKERENKETKRGRPKKTEKQPVKRKRKKKSRRKNAGRKNCPSSSRSLIRKWEEMESAGYREKRILSASASMTSTTSWLRTKIKMQSLKTGVISSITLMPVSIFS